jgi:hypothetical protein
MIATILRLALDVRSASYLGAALAGEPELAPCISAIAWRESSHELISIHEGDAWMSMSLGDGWSTRGVHGQVAAFAWPHVPVWLRWLGPVVLDVPLVSAFAATRRHRSWRCRATPACAEWRRCG